MKATATTLLLAIVSSLAFSVQAETVTQALEKCRGVDNSLQRLVCYDRVAKNVNQYAGGQESISAVPRPPQHKGVLLLVILRLSLRSSTVR